MRILILLLISLQGFGQLLPVVNSRSRVPQGEPPAETFLDSAQFSFAETETKTNYTAINGNPQAAIRSATGAYGISASTLSTGEWTSGLTSAVNSPAGEVGSLWRGYSFHQQALGTMNDSNLVITGLVPGAQYQVKIFASRLASAVPAAQRYCSYIIRDANGDTTVASYNIKGNINTYAELGIRTATNAGRLTLRINPQTPTDANHPYGYIGLLEVRRWPR